MSDVIWQCGRCGQFFTEDFLTQNSRSAVVFKNPVFVRPDGQRQTLFHRKIQSEPYPVWTDQPDRVIIFCPDCAVDLLNFVDMRPVEPREKKEVYADG